MAATGEAATNPEVTEAESRQPGVVPGLALGTPDDASEASAASTRASLVRMVGSNTAAQLVAQVATVAATLVISALLSRHLGPAGFGQYALIFAYITMLAAFFADIGLSQIAARDASQSPDDMGEILASAGVLQAGASLVAYLALIVVAGLTLDRSGQLGVAVAGILILLLPLDVMSVAFQVRLRLARLAWLGVAASVVRVFLTAGAVMAGFGLTALIGVATVAAIIRYALLPVVLRGLLRLRTLRPRRRRYRGLLVAAAPLALATSCLSVMSQLPIFFLNWLSSPDEVGFFSAALRVSIYATGPAAMLTATLYPMFSHLAESDRARLGQISGQSLRFMTLVSMPLAASGLIVGPWLMRLLYGAAFEPASGAFAILMIQAAILSPSTIIAHVLIAMGKQRTVLVSVGAGAVASIVTCLSLAEPLGAVGASSGMLAGAVAAGLCVLLAVRHALGRDLQMRGGSLVGTGLALAAGTVIASAALPTPVAAILGLAACVVVAFALGAVDRTDIQVLLDAVRIRRARPSMSETA
ncbi:MAG: oligosaccharide flippase family protein [Chloroflexi bacterium]|nr:oligosaccharide flippase family protein [Chloroflexota bacterium]